MVDITQQSWESSLLAKGPLEGERDLVTPSAMAVFCEQIQEPIDEKTSPVLEESRTTERESDSVTVKSEWTPTELTEEQSMNLLSEIISTVNLQSPSSEQSRNSRSEKQQATKVCNDENELPQCSSSMNNSKNASKERASTSSNSSSIRSQQTATTTAAKLSPSANSAQKSPFKERNMNSIQIQSPKTENQLINNNNNEAKSTSDQEPLELASEQDPSNNWTKQTTQEELNNNQVECDSLQTPSNQDVLLLEDKVQEDRSTVSTTQKGDSQRESQENSNLVGYERFEELNALIRSMEMIDSQIRSDLTREGVTELQNGVTLPTTESLLKEIEAYEREQAIRQQNPSYLDNYLKLIQETGGYLDELEKCSLKEQKTLYTASQAITSHLKYQQVIKQEEEEQERARLSSQRIPSVVAAPPAPVPVAAPPKVVAVKKYAHVRDMVGVSTEEVRFGVVFPGNIFEDLVELQNLTDQHLQLKVVGVSLDPEFDQHNEYVYSIRKTNNYDYNEKLAFSVPRGTSVKLHIALKVPNLLVERVLKGSLAVSVNGEDTYIQVPIWGQVEIPKVICQKSLLSTMSAQNVMRFAIRKGKKSEFKIPFKNTYSQQLTIEACWLTDQTGEKTFTNLEEDSLCPYNLVLSTTCFAAPAKSPFMFNIQVRPNIYFKEYNERKVLSLDKTPLQIRNVLILRIQNSTVLMHFPISLEIL